MLLFISTAHPLLLPSNAPWYQCPYFIHSPRNGHLGCFQLGAFINKVSVDICVQVSICVRLHGHLFSFLLGKYLEGR